MVKSASIFKIIRTLNNSSQSHWKEESPPIFSKLSAVLGLLSAKTEGLSGGRMDGWDMRTDRWRTGESWRWMGGDNGETKKLESLDEQKDKWVDMCWVCGGGFVF